MDNSSDPIQYSGSNIGRNHLFKQKLFLILLLPPIIAAVGFVLYTSNKNIGFDNRSKASTVPVSIELSPPTQKVNSGDTFTLGISINTGDDTVTAAELHLSYNPELQVESLVKTDYLPVILQEAGFGNGKASIVLGSDPSAPRKGSGIIASITFKALSAGTPSVRFDQETQVAALGKDTNVLTQLPAPAQITIQGATTVNPCANRLTGSCVLNDGTTGTCQNNQCIPVSLTLTPTSSNPPPTTSTTPTTHCLPLGNINCNEKVDIFDYNRMLHDFGTVGKNLPADLNDNGRVDLQDYNKLLFNFNKTK